MDEIQRHHQAEKVLSKSVMRFITILAIIIHLGIYSYLFYTSNYLAIKLMPIATVVTFGVIIYASRSEAKEA